MNPISTLLPMTSIEFDPNTAPAPAEPAESSSDDFASMLASVWCAPTTPQAPTPEVLAEPETAKAAPTFGTECPGAQPDVAPASVNPLPNGDILIPQPILTYDDKPAGGESLTVEQGGRKIALPDISLPVPKGKDAEDKKDVAAEPIAIDQVVPTPQTQTPVVPPTKGFARPPLTGTVVDPLEPKVNTPIRRPPTFSEPPAVSTSSNGNEVTMLEAPRVEVSVSNPTAPAGDSTSPAPPAPDQVTAEAIKREANLAASYLAQSTRDSRESTFEALKAQVSGNGPDARSNDADGETSAKDSPTTMNLTPVNFASALNKHSVETVKELVTPQVANQLVDLAAATQPRQQRTVRLRLRPEELGQVDVQLSRDSAGKVSAQVVVERDSARSALTQSLPQLREALERAGLQVDRLTVSSDASSFAGSSRDNRQSTNDSPRSSSGHESSASTSETQSKERVRDQKLLSLSA
jgi:flagellar hook-length control protein FliK